MFAVCLQLCVISDTRTHRCTRIPLFLRLFAFEGLVVIHILSCIQGSHANVLFVIAYMLASIVELSVYLNCKRAYIIRTYADTHKAYESVICLLEC